MDGSKVVMPFFKMMGAKASHVTIMVTKLEHGEAPKYAANHPRNIKIGFTAEGLMLRPVAVGESFYVNYPDAGNHFHTSVVQEILSENTFKTQNSIYRWEVKL